MYWGNIGSRNIQVSSVQLSKAPSAHCITHPSPQAKSLSTPSLPSAHLHLHPPHPLLWPSPHCCLCLCVIYTLFLVNPFAFFHPVPPPPFPLTPVTLLHVSMPLFLLYPSVYFVHQIPHMSEIIWYLSFSDHLISLSIIISRSIHAVTKDKISMANVISKNSTNVCCLIININIRLF